MYSARSKTITINSVYIRSIKKRELVNVYREDFQSTLPKQRPFPFFAKCNSTKQGHGSRTKHQYVKQKIRSLQQCASNGRKRLPENLFGKKERLPVAFYLFTS